MDQTVVFQRYGDYVRRAASWYVFNSMRGRVSFEDLLQEGYLALLLLNQQDKADNTYVVMRAVRNRMVSYLRCNCSALHVTDHGHAALSSKQNAYPEARDKAVAALQMAVPLHMMLAGEEDSGMAATVLDDYSMAFVSEFLGGLSERERLVCQGLWRGLSQREISRSRGIPLATVRRICGRLRDKLNKALGDIESDCS